MERGWDLMWLATGCFAPSTNLLKEVTMFLRSYPSEMVAVDCVGRLQKILRSLLFTTHLNYRYKLDDYYSQLMLFLTDWLLMLPSEILLQFL